MTTYNPDSWVILRIEGNDPHYKVLAGWLGGYLDGDSWRMNSGIDHCDFDGDYYYFYGSSGSCYKCHKDMHRLSAITSGIYSQLKDIHGGKVELLDEQDWTEKVWNDTT